MIGQRWCRVVFALAAALVAAPGAAAAQSGWSAQLVVSPLPSPYLSDWEIDPTIGELIVTNSSASTTDATLHYMLTWNGRLLLRGATDPQTIPAGESVTFNANSDVGGQADWDRDFQDLVARTGRLPEGEYEGCATIVDPGGLVLVDRQCIRFATLYPDPPHLVFPFDRDTVTTQDPIFEWQPVQLPALEDLRVGYVLAIAEVNTAGGQHPEIALESNILHYLEPDLTETSHQYPVGALPLAPGRTYAWRVQALDGDGRPVAANQGRSEVWTFVYREPEAEVERRVAAIELTPRRDTLRFAGDTSRFEVKAFDEDNVEIPGARFQWRSTDTAIARVDSTGVVTGVGLGETQIVASVDGVVDSAFSVTTVPTGLTVRFARYDAETEQPSLLELIRSGSFEDVVPKLMELLQSGEFRIPIPRLPGVSSDDDDPSPGDETGPLERDESEGGPRASGELRWLRGAERTCSDLTVPARAVWDPQRKVFVVPFRLLGDDAELVKEACLQVDLDSVMVVDSTPVAAPPECTPGAPGADSCPAPGPRWDVDTTYDVKPDSVRDTTWVGAQTSLFVISWAHPGLPRVFLAFKPWWGDEFVIPGTAPRALYWVINFLRTTTVESALLPPAYAGFFGDDSFDAGFGLTIYARRRCAAEQAGLCTVFRWINPDNPEVTLHVFAGVTAADRTLVGTGRGTSLALGLSIRGSLPVRTYDADLGGLSLDSTQLGLMFAVQDSMVTLRGGTRSRSVSVGVAPTLTVWWSGPRNQWEATGSLGVEWDTEANRRRPKLVASVQLAQVWKFWWLRFGNPQVTFARPIGTRERPEVTLGISGTMGVGPWDGNPNEAVGVDEGVGGGDVRGDIGGFAGGGGGLEEVGRGTLLITWTRMPAAPAPGQPFGPLPRGEERQGATPADSVAAAPNPRGEATDQLLPSRAEPQPKPAPSQCQQVKNGWCRNWSASFSVGRASLVDLLVALGRMAATRRQ